MPPQLNPKLTDQEVRCDFVARLVSVGQDALDKGMEEGEFALRLRSLDGTEGLTVEDVALARMALRRGYNSIYGADSRIMSLKAFDDCMAGTL